MEVHYLEIENSLLREEDKSVLRIKTLKLILFENELKLWGNICKFILILCIQK